MPPEASADFVELSADVVATYVSNNSVTRADLPALISTVHAALKHAAEGTREPEPLVPPVPINKTVFPDHIISLEDGRRYKSMKRHLSGRGLTPRAIPRQVGLAPGLPDGGAELFQGSVRVGQGVGSRPITQTGGKGFSLNRRPSGS